MSGAVAEELAQGFFVVRDMVLLDERDEVGRSVAAQGGFGEVRISRDKVFRAGVEIGEVAAASSGDKDFLSGFIGVIEQKHPPVAAAGLDSAEESGGACSEDDDVEGLRGWHGVVVSVG